MQQILDARHNRCCAETFSNRVSTAHLDGGFEWSNPRTIRRKYAKCLHERQAACEPAFADLSIPRRPLGQWAVPRNQSQVLTRPRQRWSRYNWMSTLSPTRRGGECIHEILSLLVGSTTIHTSGGVADSQSIWRRWRLMWVVRSGGPRRRQSCGTGHMRSMETERRPCSCSCLGSQ